MTLLQKRLLFVLMLTVSVLLIPLVGMQFSSEVIWTLMDFFIAALLLIAAGSTVAFISTKVKGHLKTLLILVIISLLVLIWVELAVGIFDTPLSGN